MKYLYWHTRKFLAEQGYGRKSFVESRRHNIPLIIARRKGVMKYLLILLLLTPVFAQTYTESLIYSFGPSPSDGANPVGGLVMDAKGTLYGVTQYGGYQSGSCSEGGCGTVFKLSQGKKTLLHQFTAGTDGALPNASLAIDKAGNLYGTTVFGGIGKGIVFKVTAAGKYSILHTFGKVSGDGSWPLGPLTLDAAGNIYGTASDMETCTNECPAAKDLGFGIVYKLNSKGAETVLYAFTGAKDGGWPTGNIVRDAQGNLFGTTSGAGAFGGGTFWKLSTKNVESTIYSFCSQTDCADGIGPSFLRRSSSGNFYISLLSINQNGGGGIAEVNTLNAESIVYSFCQVPGQCDAGYQPGATMLTSGTVYGTTTYGGLYGQGVVYSVTGSQETVLYNFGAFGGDGLSPNGVISDAQGNLYGITVNGGANELGAVWKLAKQ